LKNKATAFSLPCFALCFAQNKAMAKEFCFAQGKGKDNGNGKKWPKNGNGKGNGKNVFLCRVSFYCMNHNLDPIKCFFLWNSRFVDSRVTRF